MSWRQNMWFIVRLVGVAAREAVMFFLCCLSCAAAVLSSLLYVHPDMHPQAVCLSLFLLKLSSEVSEGLALLIPDTVNEKQASYTGRLTARKAVHSPPPALPNLSVWNCIMVCTTSGVSFLTILARSYLCWICMQIYYNCEWSSHTLTAVVLYFFQVLVILSIHNESNDYNAVWSCCL